MRYFTNFFLKKEEKSRNYFENSPFFHAFLAGIGVVLFWRGVWEIADLLKLNPFISIILGIIILITIGLFLQTFVGNTIIIKKVDIEHQMDNKTKKDLEKVKKEINSEEVNLSLINNKLEKIEIQISDLIKNLKI